MASKTVSFSIASVANTTQELIPVVPVGTELTVSIFACNISPTTISKVRIAVSKSTAPNTKDWIEYDAPISNEPLGRTGCVIAEGERVFVYSDTSNVAFRAEGYQGAQ